MTQQIVVGLIVALAALYAVWRWMPARWRRAAAGRLAAGSQRAGLLDTDGARQLEASLGRAGGCAACDSCSSSCGTVGGSGKRNASPSAH